MGSIKFGYLRKSELEYEVRIRGDEPMSTVAELRKQINKLYKLYPHDSIDDSTNLTLISKELQLSSAIYKIGIKEYTLQALVLRTRLLKTLPN